MRNHIEVSFIYLECRQYRGGLCATWCQRGVLAGFSSDGQDSDSKIWNRKNCV